MPDHTRGGKADSVISSVVHSGGTESIGIVDNADESDDEIAIIAEFNLDEICYEFLISYEKKEIMGFVIWDIIVCI